MTRSSRAFAVLAVVAIGCEPELSDVPFACGAEGLCPDGYTCQATVCVRDGAAVSAARPMRITWVNSGEMYWFASPKGGATLVVNDGFSQGARGLYEIHVAPDGKVDDARLILDFGEEFPTASSVVALDDSRYGVLTMSFPSVSSTLQRVSFWSVPREGSGGTAEIVAEPATQVPFQGGSEPVYVGALARNGVVDVTYADPSEGGSVILARVSPGAGTFTERARLPLGDILPLSADSLLWDLGDAVAVRVDEAAVWRVSDAAEPEIEGPIFPDGQPIYAFSDRVVVLQTSEREDAVDATVAAFDWSGSPLSSSSPSGVLQSGLEPFSAIPSPGGVLFAPLSQESSFAALEVSRLDPDGGVSKVASFERPGSDELYSGRAFARDGKVYIAWTSFHESLMDLWVASVTEGAP